LGVSRQGEFKNNIKIFLQKVHVENFFQHVTKKIDVSFSSTFFVLSRFRVFLSDGSSKTLQKTFCKKNRVEKFLQKIRPKIQNRFFLDFFLSRFWAFLDEGSSKTRLKKKYRKNKSDPSPFSYFDPPTHHGRVAALCFLTYITHNL
jgi:hypothetical protein